jgi:catechol-2,3-dioxygenase
MQINQLRLATPNLDAMGRFYAQQLELSVTHSMASNGSAINVVVGNTRLVFAERALGQHQIYHIAFNIPQNQFAEAKIWLQQRGVPLLKDQNGNIDFHFESWNAHAVYFLDPAGNILELIARHNLPNTTSQAQFAGHSLLCASEIGWVVDGVRAAVSHLQEQFGLGVYDGLNSAMFSAVGDENGLFIVVPHGRNWYPDTAMPATAVPLGVHFEVNGVRHVLEVDDG